MYKFMETRRQISRICWAFTAFLFVSLAAQVFLGVLWKILVLTFGESRVLTRAALLVSEIAMYGIAFPVFAFMMGRIPSCEMREKKKIRFVELLGLFVFCYGLTYLGSMIGNLFMQAAEILNGTEYSNPVSEMVDMMDVGMIFFTTVLIAPVMEELMFRKYLIDRMVPYGQKTAVIISGLFFALFHGNFYQFFYAWILGMVFAWLYSSTGNIRYNIMMHMMVNFMGGVIPVLLSKGIDKGSLLAMIGSGLLNIFAYVSLVIAVIMLASCYRKLSWFSGWVYRKEPIVLTFLKTPGFWLFLAGCGLMFLY